MVLYIALLNSSSDRKNVIYHATSIILQREHSPAGLQAVVINLDHRANRMTSMKSQLHKAGVPFKRFSAFNFHGGTPDVVGKTLKLLDNRIKLDVELIKKKRNMTGLLWGQIGCWQSHLHIHLKYASGDYGSTPLLILEDDVMFGPNISYFVGEQFLNNVLPKDWEMFFLDRDVLKCFDSSKTPLRPHKRLLDYFTVHYLRPPLQPDDFCLASRVNFADAYIIRSPEVAQKLVEESNTAREKLADEYWNDRLFPQKIIHAYSLIIPAVNQGRSEFGSDIAPWGYGISGKVTSIS